MKRIAVIGSGIAGLAAARTLHAGGARVTLFEASARFGGHAHTVDVTLDNVTHGVDTGFLVYNERTYPLLTRLFAELGVETAPSDMSFSVQVRSLGLEWSGSSAATVFAQKRNLLRPPFWRMLADLLRFNREATALAAQGDVDALAQPVEDFLRERRYGRPFVDWYLLPMVGCIWSCPPGQMLRFPVATLIRFCHNHGLLQLADRPPWRTVQGGSRRYVERIVAALPDARAQMPVLAVQRGTAGVRVSTAAGAERFDELVFACHAGQALQLLGDDASADERRLLGAIRTQTNLAVLHTDVSVLPRRRSAWAAWNHDARPAGEDGGICLHYLINRLQPLPWQRPVIVTLNPLREPAGVIGRYAVAHPIFDQAAIDAQRALPRLQGQRRSWFCGAWTGYGFHEDGLASGLAVADALLRQLAQPTREAA
ncbi:NAD(P)/FAD-dependent oxidoreductase [Aquabacterium humicola]|uniref:NAD(P)/FAD-dependent oxidoreductase n=1 Tax=Aquabacterium humicola TaxID=3237377 RepID=UPI002543E907|nr:FAD-dependent oxidoreductase [Rubrivivax pictus]